MKRMLSIEEYCKLHGTESKFLLELEQNGLIEIVVENSAHYISVEKLQDLERYRIWHYELNVNIEGIDIIENLLEKQRFFQEEIGRLRNRLGVYESDGDL
ncbi:chaperone modulator CbpM [Flavobacterium sp.]|uniref:chaperone modulator CbpM n=1 Tax=Flavobacterium sp. TaxID=239 RepID=UPI0025BAE38F|nr:chaperone modulator CbpM [Flavobacterium sp.]